jgi:hypothetical protein
VDVPFPGESALVGAGVVNRPVMNEKPRPGASDRTELPP